MVAASKKKLLFTTENLTAAFLFFDRDKDGKITARDLSKFLGLDLNKVSTSDIGKSYAEIIHKEAEEERKLQLDLKKAEEARIKAEKKVAAA